MPFKPFYVHENSGPGKITGRSPRGFTIKVSPNGDDPRSVVVQGAWCSHKDEFNKKTGRSQADIAESKVINKRKIPHLVATMVNLVYASKHFHESNYYYLYKYVL